MIVKTILNNPVIAININRNEIPTNGLIELITRTDIDRIIKSMGFTDFDKMSDIDICVEDDDFVIIHIYCFKFISEIKDVSKLVILQNRIIYFIKKKQSDHGIIKN